MGVAEIIEDSAPSLIYSFQFIIFWNIPMAEDIQRYLCDLETEFMEGILISLVISHSTERYKK